MKDNFILYTQQYEVLEPLSDEQLGKLLRALYLYARDKETPTFTDGMLTMAFGFVRMQIDASNAKYEEKREKMRENIRKRWERQKNTNDTIVNCDNFEDTIEYKSKQKNTNDTIVSISNDSNVMNSKESVDSMKEEPSKEASDAKNGFFASSASSGGSESESKKGKPAKGRAVDYAAIKDYWNRKVEETHSAMRRLTKMSDQRMSNVRARLREYGGDVSIIYNAMDNAMASAFMNGNNSRGFVASFDWMMSPKYFPRVLEGNYNDAVTWQPQQPTPQPQQPQEPSIGERYQQAQHRRSQEQEDQDLTVKILGLIDLLERDPKSLCRQALVEYYRNGTMKRLGIDWKP